MDVDTALQNARAIYADVSERISEIETEEDARFQLIDRLLKDVLGWAYEDIKTEPPSESGYTDYLLKHNSKSVFVVEAKRVGKALVDTRNPSVRNYKISGAAIESALSGIAQAARYCFDHGVSFAAVTTGTTWIAFMPFPGEGQNYKDGTAIVFPSLDSVLADFAKFYDLFAKDSIIQKLYRIIFSKMSGEIIFNAEDLASVNSSDDIKFLQKSSMAHDLEAVFKEFFGTLSGDSDPEMLVHCFVETKESKIADFALENVIDNLVSNVTSLKTEPENALADHIQISVEMGRGDAVVIIGNKGAGKSTFIERFFKIALSSQLREKCIVLKVDLLDTSGNQEELTSWMTSRMVAGAEREMFDKGRPSYDELQGLYFSEYQRWMEGHYKPLYDTNKTEFKIKFGEFLRKTTQEDKLGYLKHLLEDCVKNRHLTPCLIFDNTDQFSQDFQERVFQFAQSIHRAVPFSFIIMPITDASIWRLSKTGPFQTYPTTSFYLPVPSTRDVLGKRISYLRERIEKGHGNKDPKTYFLSKGIRLRVEDIKAFAACLEEVFINSAFVSRRIAWLSNLELRRSLQLAQRVMTAAIISIDELVVAFIQRGAVSIRYRKFMLGLLFGDRSAYSAGDNDFVLNVFAVGPRIVFSPLGRLSILRVLIDKAGNAQKASDAYLSVSQLQDYFEPMGMPELALSEILKHLLEYRLVDPYDPSDDRVYAEQRVAISYSGRMHVEMALTDPIYVSQMAFSTPIRDRSLVDILRDIRARKMGISEWESVRAHFVRYIFQQDALFVHMPSDAIYSGQREVRSEIRARWLESDRTSQHLVGYALGQEEEVLPPEVVSPAHTGQSHVDATVRWFDVEKGFGFVSTGDGPEAFLHVNQLEAAGHSGVNSGDIVTCEIAPGHKGLQVIGVHSVKPGITDAVTAETTHEGTIKFFDDHRGFGFVEVPGLAGDVFIHARTFQRAGIVSPTSGARVRVSVAPGRDGKGFQATGVSQL